MAVEADLMYQKQPRGGLGLSVVESERSGPALPAITEIITQNGHRGTADLSANNWGLSRTTARSFASTYHPRPKRMYLCTSLMGSPGAVLAGRR